MLIELWTTGLREYLQWQAMYVPEKHFDIIFMQQYE